MVIDSVTLLLALAAGLNAATLTVGTVSIGPGQTANLRVALSTAGARIAALQFDLAYNTSVLRVTLGVGASATAAQKAISTNALSTTGQRAMLSGGRTVMADGAVANLTITVAANAAVGSYPVTLVNLVAADPDAGVVALTGIPGSVTVANTYIVGDVYPFTADTVGNFGDGKLNLDDLILMLFAVNKIPGFLPSACSDRLDAMDLYPADTPAARGGDGNVNLNDLILESLRVNNAPGFTDRPVRASPGGCPAAASLNSQIRTSRTGAPPNLPVDGSIVLGAPLNSGAAAVRVPVYLEARRNLVRVAVTFGAGDGQSQLHFEAGVAVPTLAQDNQHGAIAAAWLEGVTVRAGERLLLGYVTGPAGIPANLKFFSMSAVALDDNRELRLGAQAAAGRDR